MRVVAKTNSYIEKLVLGYGIKDRFGQVIYGTNTYLKGKVLNNISENSLIQFDISFPANLGPGTYSIQTTLCSTETHLENNYEWKDLALIFNVVNMTKEHFVGSGWIDRNNFV